MAGTSHGHTPAAWTGGIIAFIGFCVSGAFMVMAEPLGFWVGLASRSSALSLAGSCPRWGSAGRGPSTE